MFRRRAQRPRRMRRRNNRSGQIFVDNSTFDVPASSTVSLSFSALQTFSRAFKILAVGIQLVSSSASGCVGQVRVLDPEQRGHIFTSGPIVCGLTPFVRRYRIPGPRVWWPVNSPANAVLVSVDNICVNKSEKPRLFGCLRVVVQLSAELLSPSCPAKQLTITSSEPSDAEIPLSACHPNDDPLTHNTLKLCDLEMNSDPEVE